MELNDQVMTLATDVMNKLDNRVSSLVATVKKQINSGDIDDLTLMAFIHKTNMDLFDKQTMSAFLALALLRLAKRDDG